MLLPLQKPYTLAWAAPSLLPGAGSEDGCSLLPPKARRGFHSGLDLPCSTLAFLGCVAPSHRVARNNVTLVPVTSVPGGGISRLDR